LDATPEASYLTEDFDTESGHNSCGAIVATKRSLCE
jgi:hypothetical protein